MLYCDHNATTPLRAEVLEAMMPFLTSQYGNASSVHSLGSRARCAVEEARAQVANLIGAQAAEIVFTGGGTESNNLALLGTRGVDRVFLSAMEHASVRAVITPLRERGCEVQELAVDVAGHVAPDALAKNLSPRTLVSVAWANNEVGSIQPIADLSRDCRRQAALLHVDAVQAVGKIPVSVDAVDLLSLSAHKLGGPKGVGALYVRKGIDLSACSFGGEQERGRRAGTENVAGIVGFATACEMAGRELGAFAEACVTLREALWKGLCERISGVVRNSPSGPACLPNTLHVSMEGIRGEALVAALDLAGIAVSSGSACAAGAGEPSHVLIAMGRSRDDARNGVRFSFGRGNCLDDIAKIVNATATVVERMRASRRAGATHG